MARIPSVHDETNIQKNPWYALELIRDVAAMRGTHPSMGWAEIEDYCNSFLSERDDGDGEDQGEGEPGFP